MKKQIVLFMGIVMPVISWASQNEGINNNKKQEKCYVNNGIVHRIQVGESATINNRQGAFEYIQSVSKNENSTHVLNSVSQGWQDCDSILSEINGKARVGGDYLIISEFEFDSAVLSDVSEKQLKQFILQLDDTVDSISIVGHTDSEGSEKYNYQLGFQRAKAVAEQLKASGVNKDKLTLSSRGEKEPLSEISTHERNAKNRRVEVIVPLNSEIENNPQK